MPVHDHTVAQPLRHSYMYRHVQNMGIRRCHSSSSGWAQALHLLSQEAKTRPGPQPNRSPLNRAQSYNPSQRSLQVSTDKAAPSNLLTAGQVHLPGGTASAIGRYA